jgi:hypothetical protein
MFIIGCDFHTRFQQIAMLDPTTGETVERRLEHETGAAEKFYASLPSPARVGVEATIRAQWFERTLDRYGHELWVGDAAQIRAAMVRKQKTDSRDALHILDLLLTNRFPRIWTPSPSEQDLRQLLRHRHKLGLPHLGDEPVARPGDKSGALPKKEAVELGGPQGTAGFGVGSLGRPPSAGVAPIARPTEPLDQ